MTEKLNYSDWTEFFKNINFTFFRTSVIQHKYISTIYDYAIKYGNAKVLEIAGGSGYTSVILADLLNKYDAEVIFSDLSPQIVKQVSDKFSSITNLKFEVIDSNNINYPDNSFNIIVHQGFLEHFNDEEIISFLKEQARVAKFIIFDVPNSKRWKKIQEFGNERFLSPKQWQDLVEAAQLKTYQITGRRFSNGWKKYVPQVVYDSEWFHKNFGESTIIVCGK